MRIKRLNKKRRKYKKVKSLIFDLIERGQNKSAFISWYFYNRHDDFEKKCVLSLKRFLVFDILPEESLVMSCNLCNGFHKFRMSNRVPVVACFGVPENQAVCVTGDQYRYYKDLF